MEGTLLPAIVLGTVQGVTEFLPVSSTAHLDIIPKLLGWKDPFINSLSFDVALHAGTLAAILAAFRHEWTALLPALARPRSRKGAFAWWMAAATVPAVIAGVLLEKRAEGAFREPVHVAIFLAVGAVLLWWADAWSRSGRRTGADRTVSGRALLIGCAQATAILPGLSRSGMTITAGLFLGLARREAARYSFMLSAPLLAGATIWKARHWGGFAGTDWTALSAGVLAAGFTGMLAIRFVLKLAGRFGYAPYAAYRLILAAGIMFWALSRPIP
jgi:undecaprenyl-diphosphatase